MQLNDKYALTVSAVLKKSTKKTALHFQALVSSATRNKVQNPDNEYTSWGTNNFITFVMLEEGVDLQSEAKAIFNLYPKSDNLLRVDTGMDVSELIPFKKLYFSKIDLGPFKFIRQTNKNKAVTLLFVALLVLLVALLNFVNISSFQWNNRLSYIGIVKVFGANRLRVIGMILCETIFIFLVAFLLALLLVNILVPVIARFTDMQFETTLVYTPTFIVLSFLSTMTLCLLVSIIPAWRITNSKVVNNLQKSVDGYKHKNIFRTVLLRTQLIISIALVAFTLLVNRQIHFGSSEFASNKNTTLILNITKQLGDHQDAFVQMLKSNPHVKRFSFTDYYPDKYMPKWGDDLMSKDGVNQDIIFDITSADSAIFNILNLEVVQGKPFGKISSLADESEVVVNETFVNKFGITSPLTLRLNWKRGHKYRVVGVVKDFNYESVDKKINPLVLVNSSQGSYCLLQLDTKNFNILHRTIKDLKKETAKLSPSFPVDIQFLDRAVLNMYRSEVQFRQLFTLFALAAIVICMLGVFAMSLFTCQKRNKEIGVRKVNGATIFEIVALLNYNFILQVFIALLIALPLAYWAMDRWLQNYAYKTAVEWWMFAGAGFVVLFVTLLTVTLQSWSTARKNPVEALRYE